MGFSGSREDFCKNKPCSKDSEAMDQGDGDAFVPADSVVLDCVTWFPNGVLRDVAYVALQ